MSVLGAQIRSYASEAGRYKALDRRVDAFRQKKYRGRARHQHETAGNLLCRIRSGPQENSVLLRNVREIQIRLETDRSILPRFPRSHTLRPLLPRGGLLPALPSLP